MLVIEADTWQDECENDGKRPLGDIVEASIAAGSQRARLVQPAWAVASFNVIKGCFMGSP